MLWLILCSSFAILVCSGGLLSFCAKESPKRPSKGIRANQEVVTSKEKDQKKSVSSDEKLEQENRNAAPVSKTPKMKKGSKANDDGEYEENPNPESLIEVKQVGDEIVYIKHGEVLKVEKSDQVEPAR